MPTWIGRDELGRVIDISATEEANVAPPGPEILQTGGEAVEQTVLSRTTIVTDAQIKALPTTAVEVVPAPGADLAVMPIAALLRLIKSVAYTNRDANASFNLIWAGAGDATTYADGGLMTGTDAFVPLHPASYDFPEGQQTGPALEGIDNAALMIDGNNGALGNFTGGNAANSLRVTVLYTVVATA